MGKRKKSKKQHRRIEIIDWSLFLGVNLLYLLILFLIVYKGKFSNNNSLPILGICIFYSICLMVIYHAFFVEGIITLSPSRAFFPEKKRVYFKKIKNKYLLILNVYIIPVLLTCVSVSVFYLCVKSCKTR